MKLRLKDNTIRIRLSMVEVETLMTKAPISSVTRFPGGQSLSVQIGISVEDDPVLTFDDAMIHILLPKTELRDWHLNDKVGHQWNLALEEGDDLLILVEKDFQCLTERPGEDESALYPNPNESHG